MIAALCVFWWKNILSVKEGRLCSVCVAGLNDARPGSAMALKHDHAQLRAVTWYDPSLISSRQR